MQHIYDDDAAQPQVGQPTSHLLQDVKLFKELLVEATNNKLYSVLGQTKDGHVSFVQLYSDANASTMSMVRHTAASVTLLPSAR